MTATFKFGCSTWTVTANSSWLATLELTNGTGVEDIRDLRLDVVHSEWSLEAAAVEALGLPEGDLYSTRRLQS